MSSDNITDVEKLIAETEKNVGLVGYDEWVFDLEKNVNVLSTLTITNPEVQVGAASWIFPNKLPKLWRISLTTMQLARLGSLMGNRGQ
jgi:hypothetical protein